MLTERTRETMQAYIEALLSSGDFARHLSDDVVVEFMGTDRQVRGREGARQLITYIHEVAFRTDIEVTGLVCDGARAMLEAVFAGNHIGEFEGIKASQRAVRVPYAVAYDVQDGVITRLRLYFPLRDLLAQISAAETAAA